MSLPWRETESLVQSAVTAAEAFKQGAKALTRIAVAVEKMEESSRLSGLPVAPKEEGEADA